jgi:hypothetical protein
MVIMGMGRNGGRQSFPSSCQPYLVEDIKVPRHLVREAVVELRGEATLRRHTTPGAR